jgi:Metallo-peptidase family M12B Reprolysin-like
MNMNTSKKTIVSLLLAATFGLAIAGATPELGAGQPGEIMWRPIEERSIDQSAKRDIIPLVYRTVRLDKEALTQALTTAPMEFTRPSTENPIIHLPMPDGTMARFRFEESPVVEPGLSAKYPGLKTYRAQGLDDPTATSRFDWLPNGFHAIILSPSGTVRIDPYAKGNTTDYITYWKSDAAAVAQPFECHLSEPGLPRQLSRLGGALPDVISGTQLRTYRLALAATHEYTVFVDGANSTRAHVLAAEVQIMNFVNAIFEREVAVRMVIIANNDLITYASDALCGGVACTNLNDPYTNCESTLGQNTSNINDVIGKENYDIGHLLNADFEISPGTFQGCGGGGAAFACVCNNAGKGAARSGYILPNNVASLFIVAHEMGHQFNAHHSWNGCGQPLDESNYEVGSGITIMGYAGACGNQSLALRDNTLDMFNVKSLEEIIGFSQNPPGNDCASITNTGYSPPTVGVNSPGSWTIPKETPFTLSVVLPTQMGADVDAVDPVTYDWEEYDRDPSWVQPGVPNTDADGHARPIFRNYPPTELTIRTFPQLKFILDNANVPPDTYDCSIPGYSATCLTGERLSQMRGRTMQFKVVARNNHAAGGGINTATATVTIDGRATAFAVISPNTNITVQRLTNLTVTWNPSGTAANVKISLSTNGGKTFPYTLLESTPNDGSQSVFIPDVTTGYARIKVEARENIYFDISDANFTITQ